MPSEWQTIETAPRCMDLLVWAPVYGVIISRLMTLHNGEEQWTGGGYGDPPPQPTHWMAKPEPPAP